MLRALWAVVITVALSLLVSRGGAAVASPVQVLAELSTRTVRTEESDLANVIVDSIRSAGRCEIGFMAASSFADATIGVGQASASDFLKGLEYLADTVVVVRLTGQQIRRALEHGLSLLPQRNVAFLQVSGISVLVNPGVERGGRVVQVKVGKIPLVDSRSYTVAMPSPLANGAQAYFKVWGKADLDRDTGLTIEQAVSAYLPALKTAGGKAEERIAFKK